MIPAFVLPDPEHSPARAVLVLGYLAAALFWLKAGLQARAAHKKTSEQWWLLGALLLFLLAANKAFDFRTQCEIFFRMFAKATGWYDRRQPAQFFLAIVLPAVCGIFVWIMVRTKARQFFQDQPQALAAWLLIFSDLALRQAQEWKPALNWLVFVKYYQWRMLLEVAGIGMAIMASIKTTKKKA